MSPRRAGSVTAAIGVTAVAGMAVIAAVVLTLPANPWVFWPVGLATVTVVYWSIAYVMYRIVAGTPAPNDPIQRVVGRIQRTIQRRPNDPPNGPPNDHPTHRGR